MKAVACVILVLLVLSGCTGMEADNSALADHLFSISLTVEEFIHDMNHTLTELGSPLALPEQEVPSGATSVLCRVDNADIPIEITLELRADNQEIVAVDINTSGDDLAAITDTTTPLFNAAIAVVCKIRLIDAPDVLLSLNEGVSQTGYMGEFVRSNVHLTLLIAANAGNGQSLIAFTATPEENLAPPGAQG